MLIYINTVGSATTNDATTKSEENYRPTQRPRAYDVSGLPALNRASVIIFFYRL